MPKNKNNSYQQKKKVKINSNNLKVRKKQKIDWLIPSLITLVIIILGLFSIFFSTTNKSLATKEAQTLVEKSGKVEENYLSFIDGAQTGLIICPDNNYAVASYSYLSKIDQVDIFIIDDQIFNPTSSQIINSIITNNSLISSWYLLGQNNGGQKCIDFAEENSEKIKAVITFSTVPENNLTASSVKYYPFVISHDKNNSKIIANYPTESTIISLHNGSLNQYTNSILDEQLDDKMLSPQQQQENIIDQIEKILSKS